MELPVKILPQLNLRI